MDDVSQPEMVDVADAERRRVERDLHDAQQHLARLAIELGILREDLGASGAHAAQVADLERTLGVALVELRAVARSCYPAALGPGGVGALARILGAGAPVTVRVTDELSERPSVVAELTAWFFLCEVVDNALRHGNAGQVQVGLARDGTDVVVTVADDGGGGASFEPGRALDGLRLRVRARGGELRLQSVAGTGTTVSARLPWAAG